MLGSIFRSMIIASAVFAAACGGPSEYHLIGTERSPTTDGLVTVEDLGGNRMVSVELTFLPPPERIMEGATLYIAWIRPEGGQPTMAGRLEFNESDRVGKMQATTPHNNFVVFVTAEANPQAVSPSEYVVARQGVEEN